MIPIEVIDQANKIIDLQDHLLNFSHESLLPLKKYFSDSDFLSNAKEINLLLDIILIFSEIRPKLIPYYCELLIFLNSTNSSIKSILLEKFFKASNCDESIFLNANNFYFLRQMMMTDFYSPEEIVARIELYSKDHSPEHFYSSTIFCYFAPELKELNSELYFTLFELFTKEMELITAPGCLHSIYMNYDSLSANDFEIYHKLFEQKSYIETDSIDEFQKTVSDVNHRIHPSIFGLPPILQNMPTLIQCAAFYGSLKIFKFLLLNEADLSMKDGVSRTLVHFAVAGGNLEIVHILDQYEQDFEGSLHVAAKFHQYEIFTWLVENRQMDIHDGFVLSQASIKANLQEMLFLFENDVDPNLTDESGWTPLHYASRDNVICSIKLLLSHAKIDPNLDNNGNTTALDNAVINGRYEAVEFLISSEKVDINKQTKDGVSYDFFFL